MYWRAETAEPWQDFWNILKSAAHSDGIDLPDLSVPQSLVDHWLHPDLVLSMTCSLPLRTALRNKVRYVGTFDFGVTDPAGHYTSVQIARKHSTALPRSLAVNEVTSQSGWAAIPQSHKNLDVVITGSHAASLHAVATDRADTAYLDAITWRLLQRHDPLAARVHVVAQTPPTPGLPLICALGRPVDGIRAALKHAVSGLSDGQRDSLFGLSDFVVLDEHAYLDLPLPVSPTA